jgi:uncharacterized protein (TIGR02118 family)
VRSSLALRFGIVATITALYHAPADPSAFDAYYDTTHVPLLKGVPGLRTLEVSRGTVMSLQGASPFHKVAHLHFETMADLKAAVITAEGQDAAADLANFAAAGVTLLVYDSETR